jgi:predicted transcriptional regulator YheO
LRCFGRINKKQKQFNLQDEVQKYLPLIDAMVELFSPHVEVAIHDLKQGKLVMIRNCISKRKVGDPSPLHELKVATERFPDFFPAYFKENWDGKSLKCTSLTIRDPKGRPAGLICINFDVSIFQTMQAGIGSFLRLQTPAENPVEMFSEDWQKKVLDSMDEYLQSHQLSLARISRAEKRNLVQHLYRKGIFNFKNAPGFVAQQLNISRASIYNYLN